MPQYHQSSIQNLNQPHLLNRSAYFNSQPSSGSILVSNRNFSKQLSTSPGGLANAGKAKENCGETSGGSQVLRKEFELSNLVRIKSNKLGSSAPNLCSSLVNTFFR